MHRFAVDVGMCTCARVAVREVRRMYPIEHNLLLFKVLLDVKDTEFVDILAPYGKNEREKH